MQLTTQLGGRKYWMQMKGSNDRVTDQQRCEEEVVGDASDAPSHAKPVVQAIGFSSHCNSSRLCCLVKTSCSDPFPTEDARMLG